MHKTKSKMVMFWAERNVATVSDKYPVGKTRLEPVGIMIVAIVTVMSSATVIRESGTILADGLSSDNGTATHHKVTLTLPTIISLSFVIFLKFLLWIYCRRFKDAPIAMALAEDHINDVWYFFLLFFYFFYFFVFVCFFCLSNFFTLSVCNRL